MRRWPSSCRSSKTIPWMESFVKFDTRKREGGGVKEGDKRRMPVWINWVNRAGIPCMVHRERERERENGRCMQNCSFALQTNAFTSSDHTEANAGNETAGNSAIHGVRPLLHNVNTCLERKSNSQERRDRRVQQPWRLGRQARETEKTVLFRSN